MDPHSADATPQSAAASEIALLWSRYLARRDDNSHRELLTALDQLIRVEAKRMLASRPYLAEEAAQEALLGVERKIVSLDAPAYPVAYVRKIISNKVSTLVQREARRQDREERSWLREPASEDVTTSTDWHDFLETLRTAVSDDEFWTLVLRYHFDFSYDEIGELLDKEPGAIRQIALRGRRKGRERMAELQGRVPAWLGFAEMGSGGEWRQSMLDGVRTAEHAIGERSKKPDDSGLGMSAANSEKSSSTSESTIFEASRQGVLAAQAVELPEFSDPVDDLRRASTGSESWQAFLPSLTETLAMAGALWRRWFIIAPTSVLPVLLLVTLPALAQTEELMARSEELAEELPAVETAIVVVDVLPAIQSAAQPPTTQSDNSTPGASVASSAQNEAIQTHQAEGELAFGEKDGEAGADRAGQETSDERPLVRPPAGPDQSRNRTNTATTSGMSTSSTSPLEDPTIQESVGQQAEATDAGPVYFDLAIVPSGPALAVPTTTAAAPVYAVTTAASKPAAGQLITPRASQANTTTSTAAVTTSAAVVRASRINPTTTSTVPPTVTPTTPSPTVARATTTTRPTTTARPITTARRTTTTARPITTTARPTTTTRRTTTTTRPTTTTTTARRTTTTARRTTTTARRTTTTARRTTTTRPTTSTTRRTTTTTRRTTTTTTVPITVAPAATTTSTTVPPAATAPPTSAQPVTTTVTTTTTVPIPTTPVTTASTTAPTTVATTTTQPTTVTTAPPPAPATTIPPTTQAVVVTTAPPTVTTVVTTTTAPPVESTTTTTLPVDGPTGGGGSGNQIGPF